MTMHNREAGAIVECVPFDRAASIRTLIATAVGVALLFNAGDVRAQAVGEASDFAIGSHDVLAISVLQAPELNTSVRVSDTGEISLPFVGVLRVSGLTIHELERQIEDRLRKYIREPDVSIQVAELNSRPVSVVGAVRKPGVFQIRGKQTLLQVLSLAGGVDDNAGDTIVVVRGDDASRTPESAQSPAPLIQVPLADLMESRSADLDVAIYPGDVVKVQSAALVYVVGDVKKPGSFAVRGSRGVTVLRAVALAEGLGATAKHDVRILRTSATGERVEVAVDLNAIFKGQKDDLALQPEDVLFVPTSGAKAVTRATVEMLARVVSFRGLIP